MDRPLRGKPQVLDVVASVLRHQDAQAPGARLILLDDRQSVVALSGARLVRCFAAPSDEESLVRVIDRCLETSPKEGTEVIFVGGGQELEPWIESAFPRLRTQPFVVHQLTDRFEAATWPDRRSSKVSSALDEVVLLGQAEESELRAREVSDREAAHQERGEAAQFFSRLKSRPAPATRALLVAIVALFVLGVLWSPVPWMELGFQSPETRTEREFSLLYAVSMGALWGPSVLDGEWWRLLTPGFLHGGWMHLAVNSFVLYVLGSQTERVIGSNRFLWVYTASLVGGSIASMLLTQGVSVGASGAIWGVLGAQAALAYGRPRVMPASIARAMRPQALSNLVLNVVISFAVPGIDWAAHFGGGLAGGLLLASGWLYPSGDEREIEREPNFVRRGAQLCVAVMAVAVGLALWNGRPWEFSQVVGFSP